MGSKNLEYREAFACLRPPRLAYAYPMRSDWVYEARNANSVLSSVWGGAGNILLPVNENFEVNAVLLPLLRKFDPDYVGRHAASFGDLAHHNPDARAEAVRRFTVPGESTETTWDRIRNETLPEQDCSALAGQIDAWTSAFRTARKNHSAFLPQFLYPIDRQKRLTGKFLTVPVLPGEDLLKLDLSIAEPLMALLIETRFGAVAPAAEQSANLVTVPVDEEELPSLVRYAITGQWPHEIDLEDKYLNATGQLAPSTTADLLNLSPMSHAARWTTRVTVGATQPPYVCVIGDTAEDHALAQICDRLFMHGAWIPEKVLNASNQKVSQAALTAIDGLRRRPEDIGTPVLVVSISNPAAAEALVAKVNGEPVVKDLAGAPVKVWSDLRFASVDELYKFESRCKLADPELFTVRRDVACIVDADEITTATPIQLPKPAIASQLGAGVQWQIDIVLPKYRAPARTAVPSGVFHPQPLHGFPSAVFRAACDGLTYPSANQGLVLAGDTLDAHFAQPAIRFPSAATLLEAIAAKTGATVERSDAGIRAYNAAEMWGSFTALAADLAGPVRRILNAFIPPAKWKDGNYGQGYAVRGEGIVALQDLQDKLGIAPAEARHILDRLLRINVVRRGLLLNCERCRWEAFYRIELVGATFQCQACGHHSTLAQGRWYREDHEPHWYYSLDHIVRLLLTQHGDLPLLATAHIASGAQSLLWAPELKVITATDSIEVDICSIVDGAIIVGEAKSNSKLAASNGTQAAAARLVSAAQTLTADKIVLATDRDRWPRNTHKIVSDTIEKNWAIGPRPELIELVNLGTQ